YGDAKRWPIDRYAELAARLIADGQAVVALGGPAEQPLGRRLAAGPGGVIDLTGRTSLREAMAVLALCRLAVSNDSGLLHVAAAVGTPTIGIFGPTDPARTGPTGPAQAEPVIIRRPVFCSPCELRSCPIDHRCMEWIGVEQVYETARARLAGAPAAAVFVDRDGTLNRDVGYLNDPDRLELMPGADGAVRALNEAGLRVIVVTNQSGVARGVITESQLQAIHDRLRARLRPAGATLDAIVYCPHHPDDRCGCRKPGGGLIEQARAQFPIDCARSYVIGDKLADIQLARRIGAKAVLVRSGHGQRTLDAWPAEEAGPDHVAEDVADAARWVVRHWRGEPVGAGGKDQPSDQEPQPV
ncbi:MAG: D-glycero-beta-D-manno-heptose 1,7-bisphosphate 7-phosphatase, partial [Nitrospirota bacterium]